MATAHTYNIYFSNPNKRPGTYIEVPIASFNNDTDLTFVGEGAVNYNGTQQQNCLSLLERFANTEPPQRAIEGQLWYDVSKDELNVAVVQTPYNPTTQTPEIIEWLNVGAPIVSNIQSDEPNYLWYDTSTSELKISDSYVFQRVGNHVVSKTGDLLRGPFIIEGNIETEVTTLSETSSFTVQSLEFANSPLLFEHNFSLITTQNIIESNAPPSSPQNISFNSVSDINITVDSLNNHVGGLTVQYNGTNNIIFNENEVSVTGTINLITTNNNPIINLGAPNTSPTSRDAARRAELLALNPDDFFSLGGDTFIGVNTVKDRLYLNSFTDTVGLNHLGTSGILFAGAGNAVAHIRLHNRNTFAILPVRSPLYPDSNDCVLSYDYADNELFIGQGSSTITNVADPTNPLDACNKNYIDTQLSTITSGVDPAFDLQYAAKSWVMFDATSLLSPRINLFNASVTRTGTGIYDIVINTSAEFPAPDSINSVNIVVSNLTVNQVADPNLVPLVNSKVTKTGITTFTVTVQTMEPAYFNFPTAAESTTRFVAVPKDLPINILVFW